MPIKESCPFRKHFWAAALLGLALLGGCGGRTDEEKARAVYKAAQQLRQQGRTLDALREYDRLIAFLEHTIREQFITAAHREMILIADRAEALLGASRTYRAPQVDKAAWILNMSAGQEE